MAKHRHKGRTRPPKRLTKQESEEKPLLYRFLEDEYTDEDIEIMRQLHNRQGLDVLAGQAIKEDGQLKSKGYD